jgi:hypothetical protein
VATAAKTHLSSLEALLLDALIDAGAHLDYCGYGDSWERECAVHAKLPKKIEAAIAEGQRRAAGG